MCLALPAFAVAQKSSAGLPPQYKKWLEEEVVYLISPVEKDVFLKLETDRERDLFIEAFWKHRDPVPVTDRNEFKEEHYRRIEYANRNYGRLSSLPGWKTDMGRIYIILGAPISVQRFEDYSFAYPVLVWSYQGMGRFGLPDQFNVVFYKNHGVGDYRIYSPIADGPQALLNMVGIDQADPTAAYQALFAQAPELAQFTLTLIPGEPISAGWPSMESEHLLMDIAEVPFKEVPGDYARNLLNFKSTVGVEYSANYIGNESHVMVIRDASGTAFVHYLVALDRLSVEQNGDRYITRLLVNGKVSDTQGRTIFQFDRAVSVDLSEAQIRGIGTQRYALGDVFPLIEGSYKLDLLIKNDASKEFTSLETNLVVPDDATPRMSPLLLSFKTEQDPSERIKAFKVGHVQLYPESRREFGGGDDLVVFFQLSGLSRELKEDGSVHFVVSNDTSAVKTLDKGLKDYPGGESVVEALPLAGLAPGYYKLRVGIRDASGGEILAQEGPFSVSSVAAPPRPSMSLPLYPAAEDPVYMSALADQLYKKGDTGKARALAEKAFRSNPSSPRLAMGYARILFTSKDYATVIEVLTPLYDAGNYDGLELLARSSQAVGRLEKAIVYYKQFLSSSGGSYYILDFLGECYYRTGNIQEALRAFEKSLEMNPNQEEIRKIVDSLRDKK